MRRMLLLAAFALVGVAGCSSDAEPAGDSAVVVPVLAANLTESPAATLAPTTTSTVEPVPASTTPASTTLAGTVPIEVLSSQPAVTAASTIPVTTPPVLVRAEGDLCRDWASRLALAAVGAENEADPETLAFLADEFDSDLSSADAELVLVAVKAQFVSEALASGWLNPQLVSAMPCAAGPDAVVVIVFSAAEDSLGHPVPPTIMSWLVTSSDTGLAFAGLARP